MRTLLVLAALAATLAGTGSTTAAAQDLSFREMRWRDIGPTRGGRARALAGGGAHDEPLMNAGICR